MRSSDHPSPTSKYSSQHGTALLTKLDMILITVAAIVLTVLMAVVLCLYLVSL
jgi:hypothetical protein